VLYVTASRETTDCVNWYSGRKTLQNVLNGMVQLLFIDLLVLVILGKKITKSLMKLSRNE